MSDGEIIEHAERAKTFEGKVNFGELPFKALAAWVEKHPLSPHLRIRVETFDVESVKLLFVDWLHKKEEWK